MLLSLVTTLVLNLALSNLTNSSQSPYRDAPLYPPSVCQISRQSDMAFAFIAAFASVRKEEEKNQETKPIFEVAYLGTLAAISLKFGMWSTEVGGHVHTKNRLVLSRQHRATEVRKLRFHSSCQYTHRCCAPASWAALPCVLI